MTAREPARKAPWGSFPRRFWTALSMCFAADPAHATLLLVCQTAATASTLLSTLSIRYLIDAGIHADTTRALVTAAVMAGAMGLSALFNGVCLRLTAIVSDRAGRYIDTELMRLAGQIPTVEHYERPDYANQLTLIRTERVAMAGVINAINLNLRVALFLIGGIVVLGYLDPVMLLLPAVGIPALFAQRAANRLGVKARERGAPLTRLRNHLYQVTVSAVSGKELRIFHLSDEILARHAAVTDERDRDSARAAWRGTLLTTAASVVFAAGYVVAVLDVLDGVIHGTFSVGSLVLVISLAMLISNQMSSAAQTTNYFNRVVSAAGRLLWLSDYASQAAGGPKPIEMPSAALNTGIAINDLSFRYPGTDRTVLNEITAKIPAGSVVAVVGENGSGKTTLVKLLSALYQPDAGTITADDVNISAMDPGRWHERVTAAFQDFARFEFTLGESIGAGDLPRVEDKAAVTTALARAGADGFLAEAKLEFETQLGTAWGGNDLSGGQWQTVALGRAMMRDDPLLVILDEPSASLDALAEHALFERIANAVQAANQRRGIVLLISHRFTTVSMADLIIVLDKGRIVEMGNHESLMRNDGLYSELYSLQARVYN